MTALEELAERAEQEAADTNDAAARALFLLATAVALAGAALAAELRLFTYGDPNDEGAIPAAAQTVAAAIEGRLP